MSPLFDVSGALENCLLKILCLGLGLSVWPLCRVFRLVKVCRAVGSWLQRGPSALSGTHKQA